VEFSPRPTRRSRAGRAADPAPGRGEPAHGRPLGSGRRGYEREPGRPTRFRRLREGLRARPRRRSPSDRGDRERLGQRRRKRDGAGPARRAALAGRARIPSRRGPSRASGSARRRSDRHLGGLSALLRDRRQALLAHHRPAHGLPGFRSRVGHGARVRRGRGGRALGRSFEADFHRGSGRLAGGRSAHGHHERDAGRCGRSGARHRRTEGAAELP
jgi:hypothetical protein